MSAIGPGDWLESLYDYPASGSSRSLTKGGLYCVGEVDHEDCTCWRCGDTGPGFALVGDPPGSLADSAWCLCDFRPIYRPKADLIESLKTPAKREGVPA